MLMLLKLLTKEKAQQKQMQTNKSKKNFSEQWFSECAVYVIQVGKVEIRIDYISRNHLAQNT